MTQPSASAKDIAEMYASNEFLNWFLQFSNQLNNIYNITTYDIPTAARQGKKVDALLGLTGIAVSSYLIWVMSHGRLPKNKEEVKEAFSDQAIASIPLIGNMILATSKGFDSISVPALQGPKAFAEATIELLKEKDTAEKRDKSRKKLASKSVEATTAVLGVPYSQPKKTLSGAFDMLNQRTKDIRRLFWSKYQLEGAKEEERFPA